MKAGESVKNIVGGWVVAVGALSVAGAAQAAMDPSQKQLTRAVQAFLADHGDLCMAKYTWPRDVTPADEETRSNDSIQLPVLERLGIVRSVEIPVTRADSGAPGSNESQPAARMPVPAEPASGSAEPVPDRPALIRRYSLTQKGKQYYLRKKHIVVGPHDQPTEHDADFCVAHLTLDKVVKWSPPEPVHDHLETVVRYTYRIKPADWLDDPEARKVFPIVDRIIRGEGRMLMSATVRLQDGKWVPVLPVH